uniref:Protein FAR1-RELATED SEQUENCE n=1 Tax=Lactuca sativa TaxID=4236 RepID=A0A9R1X5Q5_LACSA|nr:hypothetical protein LSAT_V11C600308010 [Lactuca sativa]
MDVISALRYVEDTWLNKYKEMFVSVWVDQHLNFGNRTSNRVDSAHSKLKKFMDSPNCNLDIFMQNITEIVQSQCFRLLCGFVSNEVLDIILRDFQRLNDLNSDSSNCGCKLRNSCGLPCACIFSVYSNSSDDIPLDLIDIFWRKLDISDTTPVVDNNILCDDIVEKIKESFKNQSKAGKQAYMRKLQEIYDLQKTDIGEPTKHQKKKVNPPNQASSGYNFSTTSEFVGIPDIFHDYIDDIHDVEGDGNCGFRAWLYIRKQLLEELESQYYAYHRVFTDGFNERGPEEFQPHRAITLAFVNDIYYMSVFFKGNYPMPPTTMSWNAHRSPSAYTWETMYWSRFELYNQLRPRSSVAPWIHID